MPEDQFNPSSKYTCVFIDCYYEAFLRKVYFDNRMLAESTYQEQMSHLHNASFGDSNFYSKGLENQGWNAYNIIYNCPEIQSAWLRQTNSPLNPTELTEILKAQVESLQPDVIYFQDISVATQVLIEELRPFTRLIVGQIASPIPKQAHMKGFDLIFTAQPNFVDLFRAQGIATYYQPLAFCPSILDRLSATDKKISLSFTGGLSNLHQERVNFLEEITSKLEVDIFGYGVDQLPSDSSIRRQHKGSVWGIDMFKVLYESNITLNKHINMAQNWAVNMRLYEATGCGALLLTDYKENLNQLFRIGEEVVAFRSTEECIALVKYFLKYPDEAQAIAKAGQKRTLKDHTYDKRMVYTAEILERHIRYQNISHEIQVDQKRKEELHSTNLQPVSSADMTSESESVWANEKLPFYQRQFVQQALENMFSGHVIPINRSLADALCYIAHDSMSILEIGCASGYNSEIIDYLFPYDIDYTGIDYSESLVNMANEFYPNATFEVGNGAHLPYADQSYSISLSSAVLLHVHNVSAHVAEMCRVAEKFIILSRTDVVRNGENRYYKKVSYGVEMTEVWYNEDQLMDLFASNGFRRICTIEVESDTQLDHYLCTYVLERTFDYRPHKQINYYESNLNSWFDSENDWTQLPILSSLELLHDLPIDFERLDKQFKSLGQKQIDIKIFNHILKQWIQKLNMTDTKQWFLEKLADQGIQQIIDLRTRINTSYTYIQKNLSDLVNWLIFSKEVDNYTYHLSQLNMKHLAWTLVQVTSKPYEQIRKIINEIVTDTNLKDHISEWTKKNNTTNNMDPLARYGRRILWYVLVRVIKPEVVIESGIHNGLGTCVLSAAIMRNNAEGSKGRLYAIDINPKAGVLVQSPYKDVVKLTIQDSLDYLKKFEGPIDLFIHDSDHSADHESEEYRIITDKLSSKSVVVSDNAHATDVLSDFALKTGRCFAYFQESPINHFYPGAGAGVAYRSES